MSENTKFEQLVAELVREVSPMLAAARSEGYRAGMMRAAEIVGDVVGHAVMIDSLDGVKLLKSVATAIRAEAEKETK